jgi:hypothetical protein
VTTSQPEFLCSHRCWFAELVQLGISLLLGASHF